MRKIIEFIMSFFKKEVEIDRNYHHYIITDHCRKRMAERKIHYKDINLCFRYGKFNEHANQFILDVTNISNEWYKITPKQNIRHLLNLLPLVITIKPGTKLVTTVFKGNGSIRSKKDWDLYNDIIKNRGIK